MSPCHSPVLAVDESVHARENGVSATSEGCVAAKCLTECSSVTDTVNVAAVHFYVDAISLREGYSHITSGNDVPADYPCHEAYRDAVAADCFEDTDEDATKTVP